MIDGELERCLKRIIKRTIKRTEVEIESYKGYELTTHGWSKGYLKGRLSALEGILGMLGDEKEAFEKERNYE